MIIRAERVLLPAGIAAAEIHVDGGRIVRVRTLGTAGTAGGTVLFPGLIDPHVHVNEPGRTDWEGFATASAAAAAGGITTIVDMPLNSVPATTDVRALELKRRAARGAPVNVEFWGGVVPGNGEALDALADAGVRGFKCFLSPSGVDEFEHVTERDLRLALPVLARRGLPLLVHAESPAALVAVEPAADPRRYATWLASRPAQAEVDAIHLLVTLCREYRARIHVVHVAAADGLDLIAAARKERLPLTAETCPHYLTFCAEQIADGDTLLKCAPPIRGRAHRDSLWRALDEGVLDLVATDHSPCPPSMKGDGDFVKAWGGIASLELSLAAVWTAAAARGCPLERLAGWLCAAPARLAGLADRGVIAEGMRADLVEWDPDAAFVVDQEALRQRHKRTPYHGLRLRGRVRRTWVGGRVVYGDAG
ncbi:MAG TPA: allantoinase AllB [Vicinamibacterales bacterium]|nr:allantoinase AllB [Vicinamibacterales bacterium]